MANPEAFKEAQGRFRRLTYVGDDHKRHTVWVEFRREAETPIGILRTYRRLTFEGELAEPFEVLCLSPQDIIREQSARLNLRYGELEVVK